MPNAQPTTKELIAMLYERLPELFERSQQKPLTDERPAQQALEKMADNARELGLDYEPVQEPVAWVLTAELDKRETTTRAHLWFSDPVNCMWTPVYTTPPAAQRQWVGLTPEWIWMWLRNWCDRHPSLRQETYNSLYKMVSDARAIEAAHGIKENT